MTQMVCVAKTPALGNTADEAKTETARLVAQTCMGMAVGEGLCHDGLSCSTASKWWTGGGRMKYRNRVRGLWFAPACYALGTGGDIGHRASSPSLLPFVPLTHCPAHVVADPQ
ncbi:unnamed protein product [Ectocarpus sp. 12 AP-2014]